MRVLLGALGVVLVLVLGSLQIVSSLALRDAAQAGSWVAVVPKATAAHVDELDGRWPLPPALRLVLARHALAGGEVALAERQIALLPASRDRTGLIGAVAERRGDTAGAVRAFLDAGDIAGLQRRIAALERSGDVAAALGLQRSMIERLRRDRSQTAALSESYYRLGLLEQSASYRLPVATRHASQVRALGAYEQAIAVAPFAQRYLIAAANQELGLGEFARAQTYLERAREADPTSVDAVAGLGDLAHRRGRDDEARAYLERARRMDPNAPAVRLLAHTLGR
jgi:tetratricopeptide (TPR) repeat protein